MELILNLLQKNFSTTLTSVLMSMFVVNIVMTRYYHQLKMLQSDGLSNDNSNRRVQIKCSLCWIIGVILSVPEIFAWESCWASNGDTDCNLLAFFGQDRVSKHLSGSLPDLDGTSPYPVVWWEIRLYHMYIVMISFLIPATIIIAAQLSMAMRYLTTRCIKYDPAPTRDDHFRQSSPSLVQAVKKFCQTKLTSEFLPSVDILITISYLACYGPYYITTLVNILSGDDTLTLDDEQQNDGPPLSLLILYNLHSTVNALFYGVLPICLMSPLYGSQSS